MRKPLSHSLFQSLAGAAALLAAGAAWPADPTPRELNAAATQLAAAANGAAVDGGRRLAMHVTAVHSRLLRRLLMQQPGRAGRVARAALAARLAGTSYADAAAALQSVSFGQYLAGAGADLRHAKIAVQSAVLGFNANALVARTGMPDTDGDGVPSAIDRDVDGDGTLNPVDGDVDGDGIHNGEDDDVDGDNIDNGQDDDVDADRDANDDDDDVDGDGELADTDLDDDGDGLDDEIDTDDDGDGTSDGDDDDPPEVPG